MVTTYTDQMTFFQRLVNFGAVAAAKVCEFPMYCIHGEVCISSAISPREVYDPPSKSLREDIHHRGMWEPFSFFEIFSVIGVHLLFPGCLLPHVTLLCQL